MTYCWTWYFWMVGEAEHTRGWSVKQSTHVVDVFFFFFKGPYWEKKRKKRVALTESLWLWLQTACGFYIVILIWNFHVSREKGYLIILFYFFTGETGHRIIRFRKSALVSGMRWNPPWGPTFWWCSKWCYSWIFTL